MFAYIDKLVAAYKANVDPNGLPELYFGTTLGQLRGVPSEVHAPDYIVIKTALGDNVAIAGEHLVFVTDRTTALPLA